jgi:hypothetical protein
MTTSDQINELAAALARARKEFTPFAKSHTAKVASQKGGYEYEYGDLADLFDATTPALSNHGLTLSQWPDINGDGKFLLVTMLMHESGQWMKGHYPLGMYERPQEQGSAISYAKRYAAGGALGIAPEKDDDGKTAQDATPTVSSRPAPKGYDDWQHDLSASAAEGTEALRAAWKASKAEFRDYLVQTNKAGLDRLKEVAAKVTEPVSA